MKRTVVISLFAAVVFLFAALERVNAAIGDEHWSPEFGWPGFTNNVTAILSRQGLLYCGNNATGATNAYLTVWDGTQFTQLGQFAGGITTAVNDLAFLNGVLYVAGSFTNVNGVPARGLARWNGASWSDVGFTNGTAVTLAPDGNDLYVGGVFTNPGGIVATNIARWDGSAWHALGSGLGGTNTIPNDVVRAIVVTNGLIYAAGNFSNAGTQALSHIAVWNGTAWAPLGGSITGTTVYGLASDGANLYAAGVFSQAGATPVNNVAKWDGANWSALGSGVNGTAVSIGFFGNYICFGGTFTSAGGIAATNFAQWDGGTWKSFGANASASVFRICATGTNLYVGGNFLVIGGGIMAGLAALDNQRWSAIGPAGKIAGLNTTVRAIAGTGTNLIVGGTFTYAGRTNAAHIGRYNGSDWSNFGSGLSADVTSLAIIGTNVYAGTDLNSSSGNPFGPRLAGWNGSAWQIWDGSAFIRVNRLAARGNDLFVAGYFFNIPGPVSADWLARWNGTNFSNVLAYGPYDFWLNHLDNVGYSALAVDGTNIYVSGWCQTSFCDTNHENCVTTDNVRRFDGQYVRPMGSGLNTNATSIAIMGTNVFFAGPFTSAGGVSVNRIARWDGTAWFDVGGGMVGAGVINALAVIGTNLYAGGSFTNMGGVPAKRVARWNGLTWSALGSGTAFTATAGPVIALHAVGQDLYVGGTFRAAGDKSSYYLARWNESKSFMDPVIRFSGPARSGNGFFTSTITTEGAPTYAIERSTNFINWTRVLTSSVTPLLLVDSNAPAGSKQFYRALALP